VKIDTNTGKIAIPYRTILQVSDRVMGEQQSSENFSS